MDKIANLTDQVELQVWATDQSITQSALKVQLESTWPGQGDSQGAEDMAREVFEEALNRLLILADSYPFTCDGNVLAPKEYRKNNSSYLFFLGLQFFGDETDLNLRTREFEGIVKTAAENYFGGKAVRIGAPWKTGEITSYKALLELVSGLLPEIGPPIRDKAPNGGDGGWDIVLVNNFADTRFSRVIVLGNCATGADWNTKGAEKAQTLFWSYFTRDPQSQNACVTFLAVPFLMSDEDKLAKAYHAGITLDRLRICEHAPDATPKAMNWLSALREKALEFTFL